MGIYSYNYMIGIFSCSTTVKIMVLKLRGFTLSTATDFDFDVVDEQDVQKFLDAKNSYYYFSNNIIYWGDYSKNNFINGQISYSFDKTTGALSFSLEKKNCPFNFINKFNIESVKILKNNLNYYKIKDTQTNNYNYGIIDIINGIVIFNTNEALDYFSPLTDYSMLASYDTEAYEICTIKKNGQCIENCGDGENYFRDANKGNHCSTSTNCDNYKILPDNICVNSCEKDFTITDNNKQCYLCKEYQTSKPYTDIKNNKCLSSKPSNSYYINEDLKIIGYCINNCAKCSNSEKCEKCNTNYFLKKDSGTCVKNCPEKYYKNGEYCLNCHQNCKTCSKAYDEVNENCETCDENSIYKYLINADNFPSNCVEKCPEGTILDNYTNCILDENYIIEEEEKKEEEEKEEEKGIEEEKGPDTDKEKEEESESKVWLYILIPFLIIIFLFIVFLAIRFYKKYYSKKLDDNLLKNADNMPLFEKGNNLIENKNGKNKD